MSLLLWLCIFFVNDLSLEYTFWTKIRYTVLLPYPNNVSRLGKPLGLKGLVKWFVYRCSYWRVPYSNPIFDTEIITTSKLQNTKNSFSHDVGQVNTNFANGGKSVFWGAVRLCWVCNSSGLNLRDGSTAAAWDGTRSKTSGDTSCQSSMNFTVQMFKHGVTVNLRFCRLDSWAFTTAKEALV
jgi:hypothetical protein